MARTLSGDLRGSGMKIAIAVARFNEFITAKLLSGAEDALVRHGVELKVAGQHLRLVVAECDFVNLREERAALRLAPLPAGGVGAGEIDAVGRAVDLDPALGSAALSTDGCALCGT